MDILASARELGAVINGGSLCLPAKSLTTFMQTAVNGGWYIRYVECLYFHEAEGAERGGTEPSMELSRERTEFTNADEFIAAAQSIAIEAIARASKNDTRPFFEVGFHPEPDLKGSGIWVRR